MVQIEFDYYQTKTIIQGNLQDKFEDIINKFIQKSSLEHNSINFIANGNKINPEKTIESQMNQLNKTDNKMMILVVLLNEEKKEKILADSKDIICPKCLEPCRFKIENYKIKLYDCINNHITDNIKFMDFKNTQKVNISNITCSQCKEKNKGNSYNHEFYSCLTCSNNLCPLCKSNHDKNHYIINYEQKNYICQKHNDFFTKYCNQCKMNVCIMCEKEHNEHNAIYFGDLMPNMDQLKEQLLEIKKVIEVFNVKIKEIIKKLNDLANAMDIYYEIQNNILNNYDMRNKNYHILQNIKEITANNDIFEK